MRRPQHLFELLFLLVLISGLAFHYRQEARPQDDYSYQKVCQELESQWRQGNLEACKLTSLQLLQREPGEMRALRYLGLIALRRGDTQKALEYFNLGLAGDGDYAELMYANRLGQLYLERGRLFVAQKQWEKAEKDAEKAKDLFHFWTEEHSLAEDLWCCAKVGQKQAEIAADSYPDAPSGKGPVASLLRRHNAQLRGEQQPKLDDEPLWHLQPCPLCPGPQGGP